jgi:nucleotide-binding universal stress UspA family protein
VIVVQSPAARWAGIAWLVIGAAFFYVYRRRVVHEPLLETVRAPILVGPGAALEYRNILVPMGADRESEEAVDLACRLAAERRATVVAITVIEVPLHKPLDVELPEEEYGADLLLDEAKRIGDTFGVKVISRVVRARSFGRAVVDEANRRGSEIVVVGADRRDRGLSKHALFSDTVDYILKHAPCRVLVAAARRAVA